MEERDLNEAMEAALERRLPEVVRLPDNSALRETAEAAYRAGWAEAADVSGNVSRNNLETHPADRNPRISEKRMEAVLARLPKTGAARLPGALYRTESAVRRYAARGYRDSAQHAALLDFQEYLKSHPEQAEARELERRLECLEQLAHWGQAGLGGEDIRTAWGIGHIPRTMDGRNWMAEQVRILLEGRARS